LGKLAKKHFAKGDLSCEICSTIETEARLIHGHEVYSFPDPETVRLERIAFLCTRCHDAIHFERTRKYCQAPYLGTVTEHYCQVNGGLTEEEFRQDVVDASNKMLSIRKFYGGPAARPRMDYGPFRDLAGQSLKQKEDWLADRLEDYDGETEMLPDHECPWATAMWREITGPDPEAAILFGELVSRHPEFDVELIEMAATYDIGDRDLRDLVIYADGRCLDPAVERRRLDAAERGRKAREACQGG
jgi:hypothetical protein